ncbi:hypothetical protein BJ742DRAFT_179960 [Cladochytrium replicatum]|nr:hypothetical protein BJ742DRAFT_179960 [Cladochytrium replicatum]
MQQLLGEVKRSAFGRRLGRRSYAFCVDLLAVISGVRYGISWIGVFVEDPSRLAFLNDYCASSTQELEPFLKDLKKVLDANHLRCLVFEAVDYTFFVNMNLLSACLDAGSVSSMILVDVSPLHTSPVVVQNKTDNPLQPTIESIRDALVSCPTNVAEVDLPMGSSDTLIITLAAVLLEFKVAFVIQEPAQGAQQSNCLGFIPLTIFTVDVGMEKSR